MKELIELATSKKWRAKCHNALYAQEYYRGKVAKIARPVNEIEDCMVLCEIQKWLREEYNIDIIIDIEVVGSDEWEYVYRLKYIPKEFKQEKRRAIHMKTIESFSMGIGSYYGTFNSYEKALEKALLETLKLIENAD